MKTVQTYFIEVTSGTYNADELADYLENGPLYHDDSGTAEDATCEVTALRAEVERLKKALGYITDISEANADRAIVEMKRIARAALAAEEGK